MDGKAGRREGRFELVGSGELVHEGHSPVPANSSEHTEHTACYVKLLPN